MPEPGPPGSARTRDVTVAIPTRNGGELFARTLAALARQTVAHELLVCDSGSRDGTRAAARAAGARVIEIDGAQFSHSGTRNLLIAEARGARVALLSQDAEPSGDRWLEHLLSGFLLAPDVAIVYGPYTPRADAPFAVRLELERWFASLSPRGEAAVERLAPGERTPAPVELLGRRGFFTDANACISREAWERIPIPSVPMAEDRALALAMLGGGYAKAFVPAAAVLHSHSYTGLEQLRRCFDEWRALREVYGWVEPASPAHLLSRLRGELGHARRSARADPRGPGEIRALASVARHQLVCLPGALLGSRAERLPRRVRCALSLERRAGFTPWTPEQAGTEEPSGR